MTVRVLSKRAVEAERVAIADLGSTGCALARAY